MTQKVYRRDPVAFVHDLFEWKPGEGPAAYQEEILAESVRRKRIAIRGPHGLGKSAVASWLVLHFALTNDGEIDWKLPTTASVWRQLTKFLWPEIHKWSRRIKWDKVGRGNFSEDREILDLSLKLSTGEAFAMAASNPASLEGSHASRIKILFDEAKSVIPETWDALEGALSVGDATAAAFSTPGRTGGRFYDIFKKRDLYADWWPRFVTKDEVVAAGRMDPFWAEDRARQWGATSPVYLNRVEGEFADDDPLSLIPFTWVEAAVARGRNVSPETHKRPVAIGVDVGGGGEEGDASVVVAVYATQAGVLVGEPYRMPVGSPGQALTELAGKVGALINGLNCPAYIDGIGIGAGVIAFLKERGLPARPFIASRKTGLRDASGDFSFLNWRSAMWFLAKERLTPGASPAILLPDDNELVEELTAPRSTLTSAGAIQVEEKKGVISRLNRSTDVADAVLMALMGPVLWAEQEMAQNFEVEYRPRRAGERWLQGGQGW